MENKVIWYSPEESLPKTSKEHPGFLKKNINVLTICKSWRTSHGREISSPNFYYVTRIQCYDYQDKKDPEYKPGTDPRWCDLRDNEEVIKWTYLPKSPIKGYIL